MTSNVVGAQPEMLYIDQALRVDFEDFEELSLPVFRVVDYER